VTPALLLLLIRRGMVEPEHFAAVRERRKALPLAARRPRTTKSSCGLYPPSCSTGNSATARSSASCSPWGRCWLSGRV
jgi:hypothetical protein